MRNTEVLSRHAAQIMRFEFPLRRRAIIPSVPKSTLGSIDRINPRKPPSREHSTFRAWVSPHGFIDRSPSAFRFDAGDATCSVRTDAQDPSWSA